MRQLTSSHIHRYQKLLLTCSMPCCSKMSTSAVGRKEWLPRIQPKKPEPEPTNPIEKLKKKVRNLRAEYLKRTEDVYDGPTLPAPIQQQMGIMPKIEDELIPKPPPPPAHTRPLKSMQWLEEECSFQKELRLYKDYQTLRKIDHPTWVLLKPHPEDLELIHLNEFEMQNLVDELIRELPTVVEPQRALAEGMSKVNNSHRISGAFFMFNVLLPMERKLDSFINTIRESPDTYLPTFVQWCGNTLSDLEVRNRITIIQRFINAVQENNLPLTLPLMNNLMSVYIQNDHDFDPDAALDMVEMEMKVYPDQTFFNNYIWQRGKYKALSRLDYETIRFEFGKRGLFPDVNTTRGQILSHARLGMYDEIKVILDKAPIRYGGNAKKILTGAALIGFSTHPQLVAHLRKLLNDSVVKIQFTPNSQPRYVIDAPADDIFTVIWNLATISKDGYGEEYLDLINKICLYTQTEQGHSRMTFREIDRHLVHDYYYTALVLLDFQSRMISKYNLNPKDFYLTKNLQRRFAYQVIKQNLPQKLVVDIARKLKRVFGDNARFFDELAYAILNYKGYDGIFKRYETLATYIDAIDPERERPQLIFPFLAKLVWKPEFADRIDIKDRREKQQEIWRLQSTFARQKINLVYLFTTELKYKNFSQASPVMFKYYMVNGIIQRLSRWRPQLGENSKELLDVICKSLMSYGMDHADVCNFWKAMLIHEKRMRKGQLGFPQKDVTEWLNENAYLFDTPSTNHTFDDFKQAVLKRDINLVHEMLASENGIEDFSYSNVKEIIDPLMDLYVNRANLSYVHKLLIILTRVQEEVDPKTDFDNTYLMDGFMEKVDFEKIEKKKKSKKGEVEEVETEAEEPLYATPMKNHHFLRILLKRFAEMNEPSVQKLMEYVQEFKKMCPQALHNNKPDSTRAFIQLFKVLLKSCTSQEKSNDHVQNCAQLMQLLFKHQFIFLNLEETLTPFFVQTVLRNYNPVLAVDIWDHFQKNLHCSNAIVPLLQHALLENNMQQKEFLLHQAKKYMDINQLFAYYVAVLINIKKPYEAEKVLSRKPIKAQYFAPVFGTMLNLIYYSEPRLNFAKDFLKLILRCTDLTSDDAAQKKIHHSWIRVFANQAQEVNSCLDIYELLLEHRVYPTWMQMKELHELFKRHGRFHERWMVNSKTSLLNLASLNQIVELPSKNRIRKFENDMDLIQIGKEPIHQKPSDKMPEAVKEYENLLLPVAI